jgi:hypothetical protein
MADEQQLPYQNASPVDQNNGQQSIQVNIDYLKTTRVHICMPCYGGQLTESTFMSFIKWANIARQLGLDWTVETMTNESLISRARNTLAAKFLNTEGSTHLMFIDADIGWEPWHLLVMLNHDKDVVGGLYPMKSLPVKWCVNGIPNADQNDPSGLIEVTKTGTGFLLIKRDVFEKLNAHPAVKPFINDIGLDPALNPYMKTYFDTAVRENRYYSEDWTFCENWRDIGGKVFVDKRVLLKHTGTYVFDYQTQDKLYADLHQIALTNQANQPQIVIQQQPTASDLAAAATPVEATVIATNKKVSEETTVAE